MPVDIVTPYYSDDLVTIYHADARDVIPELPPIDLVFTSPPYNLGTSSGGGFGQNSLAAADMTGGYGSYDDAMPADEYDRWQTMTLWSLWSKLSPTGAIFYNHKPRIQNGVAKLPTDYGVGLTLRQVIMWDRGTGLNFSGSFFLPCHEWIVVWAREGFRLRSKKAAGIGDVWRVRPETDNRHPAPFPLGLPTRAIDATSAEIVLDPFAGSGTTLLAARNLGRHAIGIEIDERYCEIAANRISQGALAL
jgi:DNA modification methylase